MHHFVVFLSDLHGTCDDLVVSLLDLMYDLTVTVQLLMSHFLFSSSCLYFWWVVPVFGDQRLSGSLSLSGERRPYVPA